MGRRRNSGGSFSEDLPDGDATVDMEVLSRSSDSWSFAVRNMIL